MGATTGSPLELPDVTLCAVDTRTPALALRALRRSMEAIRFGEVVLVTTPDAELPENAMRGVRRIPIAALPSIEAYSLYMLRELLPHVHTSHVLVTQWDGHVIHPEAWDPGFLAYDYIGAPWYWDREPMVGNGGFSLRSRRLLQALQDLPASEPHPEDVRICLDHRAALERDHGLRFAPVDVATRFSYESGPPPATPFGFHGIGAWADVLPAQEVDALVRTVPPQLLGGDIGLHLARRLMRQGALQQLLITHRLLGRRFLAGERGAEPRQLWWRCTKATWAALLSTLGAKWRGRPRSGGGT